MEATCFKTKTDTEDELLESDGKQKTTDQILYKREFKKKKYSPYKISTTTTTTDSDNRIEIKIFIKSLFYPRCCPKLFNICS